MPLFSRRNRRPAVSQEFRDSPVWDNMHKLEVARGRQRDARRLEASGQSPGESLEGSPNDLEQAYQDAANLTLEISKVQEQLTNGTAAQGGDLRGTIITQMTEIANTAGSDQASTAAQQISAQGDIALAAHERQQAAYNDVYSDIPDERWADLNSALHYLDAGESGGGGRPYSMSVFNELQQPERVGPDQFAAEMAWIATQRGETPEAVVRQLALARGEDAGGGETPILDMWELSNSAANRNAAIVADADRVLNEAEDSFMSISGGMTGARRETYEMLGNLLADIKADPAAYGQERGVIVNQSSPGLDRAQGLVEAGLTAAIGRADPEASVNFLYQRLVNTIEENPREVARMLGARPDLNPHILRSLVDDAYTDYMRQAARDPYSYDWSQEEGADGPTGAAEQMTSQVANAFSQVAKVTPEAAGSAIESALGALDGPGATETRFRNDEVADQQDEMSAQLDAVRAIQSGETPAAEPATSREDVDKIIASQAPSLSGQTPSGGEGSQLDPELDELLTEPEGGRAGSSEPDPFAEASSWVLGQRGGERLPGTWDNSLPHLTGPRREELLAEMAQQFPTLSNEELNQALDTPNPYTDLPTAQEKSSDAPEQTQAQAPDVLPAGATQVAQGGGGYEYHLYQDGTIRFLHPQTGRQHYLTPQSDPDAYTAISNQVGGDFAAAASQNLASDAGPNADPNVDPNADPETTGAPSGGDTGSNAARNIAALGAAGAGTYLGSRAWARGQQANANINRRRLNTQGMDDMIRSLDQRAAWDGIPSAWDAPPEGFSAQPRDLPEEFDIPTDRSFSGDLPEEFDIPTDRSPRGVAETPPAYPTEVVSSTLDQQRQLPGERVTPIRGGEISSEPFRIQIPGGSQDTLGGAPSGALGAAPTGGVPENLYLPVDGGRAPQFRPEFGNVNRGVDTGGLNTQALLQDVQQRATLTPETPTPPPTTTQAPTPVAAQAVEAAPTGYTQQSLFPSLTEMAEEVAAPTPAPQAAENPPATRGRGRPRGQAPVSSTPVETDSYLTRRARQKLDGLRERLSSMPTEFPGDPQGHGAVQRASLEMELAAVEQQIRRGDALARRNARRQGVDVSNVDTSSAYVGVDPTEIPADATPGQIAQAEAIDAKNAQDARNARRQGRGRTNQLGNMMDDLADGLNSTTNFGGIPITPEMLDEAGRVSGEALERLARAGAELPWDDIGRVAGKVGVVADVAALGYNLAQHGALGGTVGYGADTLEGAGWLAEQAGRLPTASSPGLRALGRGLTQAAAPARRYLDQRGRQQEVAAEGRQESRRQRGQERMNAPQRSSSEMGGSSRLATHPNISTAAPVVSTKGGNAAARDMVSELLINGSRLRPNQR